MRSVRFALAVTANMLLGGCLGIAHYSADVVPVTIEVNQMGDWTPGLHKIEVVCPHLSGDSTAFVGLLSSNVPMSHVSYEWFVAELEGQPVNFKCSGEQRYIGVPFVPFVSLASGPEASKSRNIFLRVDGADQLVKIRVVGKKTSVSSTNLASAKLSAPQSVFEPEPKLTSPQQTDLFLKHVGRQLDYYQSIRWSMSDAVDVKTVSIGDEGDIVSVKLGVKSAK